MKHDWLKETKRRAGWHLRDWVHNTLNLGSGKTILVFREASVQAKYNQRFLAWVASHRWEALGRFELRRTLARRHLGGHALFVPWVQDPVRERNPRLFDRLIRIQERFDALGVPTVNRVENLSNAVKSVGAARLAEAGLRVPRMVRIDEKEAFLREPPMSPPFFVRRDEQHGGPIHFISDWADLQTIEWSKLGHDPVAVEYRETRSDDGLYRKYRAFVIGERTLPRHMIPARGWVVHSQGRVHRPDTHEEELAYYNAPEPNAELMQRARRALNLDYAAVDYSYEPDGQVIIWEVNPMPTLWSEGFNLGSRFDYHRAPVERIYDAMLDYYLTLAGLTPERAEHRPASSGPRGGDDQALAGLAQEGRLPPVRFDYGSKDDSPWSFTH